jgi:hypothetical protein
MPATNARAAFIREQFRIVTSGPDTAIDALWGKLARRTTEPVETLFVSKNDAQVILDNRISLVGSGRRRMVQEVLGEQTGLGIDYTTGSPTATVIDDDRELNAPMLISEITIDFGAQKTKIESWG